MAARSTLTVVSGTTITSSWGNSVRNHLTPATTSDDVSSEGQLAVNTSTDQLVIHNGSAAQEIARYGALSSVVCNTVQSFAVSASVVGGMSRSGTWCDAMLRLSFTSNGSVGNIIAVGTNLPGPSYSTRAGGFLYQDVATGIYEGSTFIDSSGQLLFYVHNNPIAGLGQTPSFAIVSGDTLWVNLRYAVV